MTIFFPLYSIQHHAYWFGIWTCYIFKEKGRPKMWGDKSKATRTLCGIHLMGKNRSFLSNVNIVCWYDEWALSSIPLGILFIIAIKWWFQISCLASIWDSSQGCGGERLPSLGEFAGFFCNTWYPTKAPLIHQEFILCKKDRTHLKEPEEICTLKIARKAITNWDQEETVQLGLIQCSENHSPISQLSLYNHISV